MLGRQKEKSDCQRSEIQTPFFEPATTKLLVTDAMDNYTLDQHSKQSQGRITIL